MEHWDLIAKELSGELSKEERAQLDAWINESDTNKDEYLAAVSAWDMTGNGSTIEPDVALAWNKVQNIIDTPVVSLHKKKRKLNIGLIAAVFIGIAAIGTVLNFLLNNEEVTILTAQTDVEFHKLPDGSEIWLNKGSELSFTKSYNKENRMLELTGEAFFDVKSNPSKPFIIKTKRSETKVLGTSFSVRSMPNQTEDKLVVKSGKVSFSNGEEKEVFRAGEKGTLTTLGIIKMPVGANDFAWQKGVFTYDNTSLRTITEDLKVNYGIEVELNNKALSNCKFTGDLTTKNLDQNIEVLSLTNGLTVTRKNGGYVLSGEGCE